MQFLSSSKWGIVLTMALTALFVSAHAPSARSSDDMPAAAPAETCPIKAGELLPSLPVTAADGTAVDLAVSVKQKPTLLVFYRGGW